MAATGVILFSSKAVLVKLAYQFQIDELALLLLRMTFALPFYLGVWIYNRKQWHRNPVSKTDLLYILGIGFVGYYLASYLDFKGLVLISASLERLILFIYPTLVLLLSALLLKKPITLKQVSAILVTYLGLFVIFWDSNGITDAPKADLITGSLLIFGCAFTYALYLVGSNFLVDRVGSVRLTTYSLIVSCVAVCIHYSLTEQLSLFSYPWQVYVLGFCMALFATVIPSFLIVESIRTLGASNVSIIGSLGPISTITLSIIFLNESLTGLQTMGALIIIMGVAIVSRTK
jgi:drug/metabolite transporter (DMT)-like permease